MINTVVQGELVRNRGLHLSASVGTWRLNFTWKAWPMPHLQVVWFV